MAHEIIVVHGNGKLAGDVRISGAKNSALKLMAAAILAQGEVVIRNVPRISDIDVMSEVLECLGARVVRNGSADRDEHVLTVDTAEVGSFETPYELVSKMRASISVLGPLIARFGRARVAMPGGCQIGARKIDMHLKGLEALGVTFEIDHGYLEASTENGLRGASVALDFPSVGATENMLNEMGAHVRDAGSSIIRIEGVPLSTFHPCDHTTIGDRIEAGTFLVGGALTGGPVTARGINPSYLRMAIAKFREMGCAVDEGADFVTVSRTEPLRPVEIQTLPHPGFPTDLQAQFMLLAACADGTSVITENVFENRFMFAAELARMGADIVIEDHHSLVRGGRPLQGAPVSSTDLRAGAALVLAGIVAEGETRVHKIDHIDRGYEDYVGKLQGLGADVTRELPYSGHRATVRVKADA